MKIVGLLCLLLFSGKLVAKGNTERILEAGNKWMSPCLTKTVKNMLHRSEGTRHEVITVSGNTYEEARAQLEQVMPSVGFLQTIKHKEVQKKSFNHYSSNISLSKSMKANVDLWTNYRCWKKGRYFITAMYAKAGVKYIKFDYPKEYNLANLKKICRGYDQITLLMLSTYATSNDLILKAEKVHTIKYKQKETRARMQFLVWKVACGKVKAKIKGWKVSYHNDFQKFMALEIQDTHNSSQIFEETNDWWLELTKGM